MLLYFARIDNVAKRSHRFDRLEPTLRTSVCNNHTSLSDEHNRPTQSTKKRCTESSSLAHEFKSSVQLFWTIWKFSLLVNFLTFFVACSLQEPYSCNARVPLLLFFFPPPNDHLYNNTNPACTQSVWSSLVCFRGPSQQGPLLNVPRDQTEA